MAFFATLSAYFGPSTRVGGKIRVEQAAKKMATKFAGLNLYRLILAPDEKLRFEFYLNLV